MSVAHKSAQIKENALLSSNVDCACRHLCPLSEGGKFMVMGMWLVGLVFKKYAGLLTGS